MLVNKKLGRFKQWAGERMGGEVKTNMSEDFKDLESEMTLRNSGMERLQKSMLAYVKSLSKREGEDKEKALPIGYLGSTMISHGEDFDPDSEFGSCLLAFGRTNERLARVQENYVANASSSWMEGIDRSMAQLKEYQAARKKLETRRLAYDTSLAKMQKQKKEDFRVEEELRSQKTKYEESSEDVYRRMQDIKESEAELVTDMGSFLEAQLNYYDRCRETILQLQRDWPASDQLSRQGSRTRNTTAHNYAERFASPIEEEPKRTIPRVASCRFTGDMSPSDRRPASSRAMSYEVHSTPTTRDASPAPHPRLSRVPTDSSVILANRSQLRPVKTRNIDVFGDANEEPLLRTASSYRDLSPSTSTTSGNALSRNTSWSSVDANSVHGGMKKAPPPPPPSRAKKPPPPPPAKRAIGMY